MKQLSVKLFSVIMAAVLLLLHFTSCASSSAEPSIEAVESSAEKESGENADEQSYVSVLEESSEAETVGGAGDLEKAINETDKYNLPFERLNAYTYGDFMIQLTHGKKPSSSPKRTGDFSYGMQSINTFDVLYPINKLTVINNDCIFAEYKLDNNGTILRAYVVFDRYVGQSESVGEFEQWNNYGEMYFAYPELNLERISVYKGDTVRIDELPFLIDHKYTARFIKANGADSWRSEETLILRDGYAIINYSVDSSSSDMITITDITFIPYGEKCDKYPYNSLIANAYVPDFGR